MVPVEKIRQKVDHYFELELDGQQTYLREDSVFN